jgi:hypothetical protein
MLTEDQAFVLRGIWLFFMTTAFATLFVSWVWITIVAFKTHPAWGVACFAFPWFGPFVFLSREAERAENPIILGAAAFAMIFVLILANVVLERVTPPESPRLEAEATASP